MPILALILLWPLLSIMLGLSAKRRGHSFWLWFLVSMIFDPILGFIFYKIIVRRE